MTQSASAVTVDLDELEALAKAAAEGITSADWFTAHHFLCECYEEQDAAFIAALNPTVALALLQELRAHREREASGGWVACSERMPEATERVWFYAPSSGGIVRKGEYSRDGRWCTSAGFEWSSGEVTHWMHRPLEPARPAPPEGSAATEGEA